MVSTKSSSTSALVGAKTWKRLSSKGRRLIDSISREAGYSGEEKVSQGLPEDTHPFGCIDADYQDTLRMVEDKIDHDINFGMAYDG